MQQRRDGHPGPQTRQRRHRRDRRGRPARTRIARLPRRRRPAALGRFRAGTRRASSRPGPTAYSTDTNALATENLDLDLDGAESLVDEGVYGKVRHQRRVQRRQAGLRRHRPHERRHGLPARQRPRPDHRRRLLAVPRRLPDPRGRAAPRGAPGKQRIWAASAQGAGAQALTWDVADGDWSVVVMNADGSARSRRRHQRRRQPRLPRRGGQDLADDRLRAADPGRRTALRRRPPAARHAAGRHGSGDGRRRVAAVRADVHVNCGIV